mgnify:FL=1
MKKFALVAAAALVVAVSFSSCKKCVTCTYTSGTSDEYCAKEKSLRDTYKTSCELSGGTAKTK